MVEIKGFYAAFPISITLFPDLLKWNSSKGSFKLADIKIAGLKMGFLGRSWEETDQSANICLMNPGIHGQQDFLVFDQLGPRFQIRVGPRPVKSEI